MGYEFYEGMIDDNAEILQIISDAIAAGEEAHFRCKSFREVRGKALKMQNLMKATEVLPREQSGRYAHLRAACSVSSSYDPDSPAVVVKPKRGHKVTSVMQPSSTKPDERAASKILQAWERIDGARQYISFLPLPTWETQGEAIFWTTAQHIGWWPDGEIEDVFTDGGAHFLNWEQLEDGQIAVWLQYWPKG